MSFFVSFTRKRKEETRIYRREHKKILQNGVCLKDIKSNAWNGLKEEMIMEKNVHQLKEKMDKYGYGDRTTQV